VLDISKFLKEDFTQLAIDGIVFSIVEIKRKGKVEKMYQGG